MKCNGMERDMEAYLDGTLSGKRKAEFDGHLEHCAACQKGLSQRRRLGKMLSGSMQKIAGNLEPPAKILSQALRIDENGEAKPVPLLVLWPKFVAAAVLPLLALALFFVFMQKKNEKAPDSGFVERAKASYLKLAITHFNGPSSQDWSVKRACIKRSNGESGSLILELTKTL